MLVLPIKKKSLSLWNMGGTMKDILFKILVVLLSPVYFMFWIFANIMGLAMEIGQPILDVVLEKVEKMSSFWKEFFKRKK